MKSFELSIDNWRQLKTRLRDRLDEIEHLQDRFPVVAERLRDAAGQLHASRLSRLVGSTGETSDETISPMSPAEALAFAKRHAMEQSPRAGYQQMVRRIREDYDAMRLSNDLLKEIHRCILNGDAGDSGQWKTSNNFFPILDEDGAPISSILTVEWELVPHYMESLEERFTAAWNSEPVNRLLLIAVYWLDLLAIHPFRDGNGRVARLAVMLLLCQSGHDVMQHTSLEGFVSRRRTAYVTALRASLNGWLESRHDPFMWCAFVIDSMREAYVDVSRRTDALVSAAEETRAITTTLASMPHTFRMADLQTRLPDIPEGMLRMVLNLAREDGMLRASVSMGSVIWEKTLPVQK